MKSRLWIVLIIIVLVALFLIQKQGVRKWISPSFTKDSKQTKMDVPNATPNAPKTYNLDSSTDLKKELNSINPQVLESDFGQY